VSYYYYNFLRERERERERGERERERERKELYVQSTQIDYIRTSKAWKKGKYYRRIGK